MVRLTLFAVAVAITGAFFIDLCHAVFDCGCRSVWNGAAAACNVHRETGPHCPWCAHPIAGGAVAFFASVGAQAWVFFRKGGMGLFARFALALAAAPTAGAIAGALQAWLWDYWRV